MIARGASLVLAVMLAASCGATRTGAAASPSHTTATAASPSATPLIDVNDMMGGFPPATFFVLTKDGVKAIALLNHATRYTIPTSGTDVQVAAVSAQTGVPTTSPRVYVLDQISEGARLRWFDIDNGTERASQIVAGASVVSTGIGHGALAIDGSTGTLYALLKDPSGKRVDQFDWFTLRRSVLPMLRGQCGERVAASSGRVAVVCMSSSKDGELRIADGTAEFKLDTNMEPNSMAMLGDGTLMAGDLQGNLVRLARHQTALEKVNTLKDYGAKLIPDGIAVNAGCCFYFGIIDPQANDVQVRMVAGGMALVAFPSISQPVGGLFVQAPFAYFVIAGKARHVDINQGFGEIMADFGPSALPGAVANR
ncbi:MAG: hypothetical protein AUH85_09345 [Chloroflexi bacterium 13_1_40CM_4_68_4]|nr:MAG: hypothetical protein AUH85_09345 [Chloroflexi bacterium 13_1_40CM_4_68_4]